MKFPALFLGLMAVVLIAAYLALRVPAAVTADEAVSPTPDLTIAAQQTKSADPATAAIFPENDAAVSMAPQTPTDTAIPEALLPPPRIAPAFVNMPREQMSLDHRRLLLFMRIGRASEDADRPLLSRMQARFALDDDQFRWLIEHSRRAAREAQDWIEKERDTRCPPSVAASLQALAPVLTASDRKTYTMLETIGARVDSSVDSTVLSRVDAELMTEPAYDNPIVDYSMLFAEQNMSLEQATRFFCGGNNPRSN